MTTIHMNKCDCGKDATIFSNVFAKYFCGECYNRASLAPRPAWIDQAAKEIHSRWQRWCIDAWKASEYPNDDKEIGVILARISEAIEKAWREGK